MKIDYDLCIGCEECLIYCPVEALNMVEDTAEINQLDCVECFNCYRSEICPVDAIIPESLNWPRSIRRALSDPQTIDDETGISGRGTAEMKTNELTNRIKFGFIGVGIELGRPGLGTSLMDVQKVAMAISSTGIVFEKENPITRLMFDSSSGKIKDEVLWEKVLTAILEGIISVEKLSHLLNALEKVCQQIETVASVGLSSRVGENGSLEFDTILKKFQIFRSIEGKVNIGLGRRLGKIKGGV